MKLSLVDRVIIINSILPTTGTIEQIRTILSIKSKIKLTEQENASLKITVPYNNIVQIDNTTDTMLLRDMVYNFSVAEIELLKLFSNSINSNGWVTESSLSTVEYLINYTIEE